MKVLKDLKGRFVRGNVGTWNGKRRDKETKKKISNSLKGNIPWNKGKKGLQSNKTRGISKGFINSEGYLMFYRNGKGILAHREIWEKYHNKIPKGYELHHKDENKLNNDISNLILVTRSQHAKIHYKDRKEDMRNGRKKET